MIVQLNTSCTQFKSGIHKPPYKPPCIPPGNSHGVLSQSFGHRTARIEPGDLPLLVEVVSNRLIFLWHCTSWCRRKTDCLARPLLVGSTCRCRRAAVVPRLPTLHPGSPSGRPGCPRCVTSLRSSTPRCHARQETHFVRLLRSLPRWQSASSTPTRAAAGFSWTSPAASEAVAPAALYLSSCTSALILAYLPLTQLETFSPLHVKLSMEVQDEKRICTKP